MRSVAAVLLGIMVGITLFNAPLMALLSPTAGSMEHCPFMSHTDTVCPMSLPAHAEALRALFAHTTTPRIDITALMIVFLCGAALYSVYRRTIPEPSHRGNVDRLQHTPHACPATLHQLMLLFSRGILNAKTF